MGFRWSHVEEALTSQGVVAFRRGRAVVLTDKPAAAFRRAVLWRRPTSVLSHFVGPCHGAFRRACRASLGPCCGIGQ